MLWNTLNVLDAYIIDAVRREERRRRSTEDRPRVQIESPDSEREGESEDVEGPADAVIRIDLRQSAC